MKFAFRQLLKNPGFSAVVAYALLISLVAGVGFALMPGFRASRSDLVTALKGKADVPLEGIRPLTFRNALVTGQVGVCFVLLVVAGLFARGLQKAHIIDLGFQPEGVLAMPIDLESRKIPPGEAGGLYERIAERLAALPRVRQVSFAKFCQGDERFIVSFNYELTTATETNSFVWGNVVGLGYFRALGTPIVRGRDFTPSDVNTRAVVIVNQRMADQLWPGQEPLGQRMKVTVNSTTKSDPVWAEVIGVAKDGQYFSLFQNGRGPFLSVLCYLLFNASGL